MPPHLHHGSGSWECPVWLTVVVVLVALGYLRGWLQLRWFSSKAIPAWRAVSFLSGLALTWVAVASPIGAGDERLLTFHMVQHLLLMSVASPLVLLGAPLMSLAHGLPPEVVRVATGLLRRAPLPRLGKALGQPAVCWVAATVTLAAWHIPAALTLSSQSAAWHAVAHASFLATGLLFWWPVVQPWPSMRTGPSWSLVLYLFLAMLPCDILAGFLVFSDRVVYTVYLQSGSSELSVLADQQFAGALMWTAVTMIYLVAGTLLATELLMVPRHEDARLPRNVKVA